MTTWPSYLKGPPKFPKWRIYAENALIDAINAQNLGSFRSPKMAGNLGVFKAFLALLPGQAENAWHLFLPNPTCGGSCVLTSSIKSACMFQLRQVKAVNTEGTDKDGERVLQYLTLMPYVVKLRLVNNSQAGLILCNF